MIVVVGEAQVTKPVLEPFGPITVVDIEGKLVVKSEAPSAKAPAVTPPPAAATAAPVPQRDACGGNQYARRCACSRGTTSSSAQGGGTDPHGAAPRSASKEH